MSTLPPRQNNYGVRNDLIPRYRYLKQGLVNTSQAVFQPSNLSSLQFRIPALSTVNLSRSYISYSFTIPASATPGVWVAVSESGCDFASVQYQSSSSLLIADVSYANKYVHIMEPYRSSLEKGFLSNGKDQLTKNRPILANPLTNITVNSQDGLTAAGNPQGIYAGSTIFDRPYLSFSSQPNQAVNVNRNVPLSVFKNTLFEMDVDIFHPIDMYLNVNLAPLYQVFEYTTTPQTPDRNVTLPTASITCTSMQLYLAIETNTDIADALKIQISKGPMKISIPYLFNSVLNIPAAVSSSSNSFLISKNLGRCLNAVCTSFWNINQNSLQNFDCQNIQGCKVSQYQTFLDATPLQNGMLNVFNPNAAYSALIWSGGIPYNEFASDWRCNQEALRGTQIVNYSSFMQNFLHQDQFGIQPFSQIDPNAQNDWFHYEMSGLSMMQSGDHSFSVNFNCPGLNTGVNPNSNSSGGLIMFSCLFTKTLSIDVNGLYLSS